MQIKLVCIIKFFTGYTLIDPLSPLISNEKLLDGVTQWVDVEDDPTVIDVEIDELIELQSLQIQSNIDQDTSEQEIDEICPTESEFNQSLEIVCRYLRCKNYTNCLKCANTITHELQIEKFKRPKIQSSLIPFIEKSSNNCDHLTTSDNLTDIIVVD